MRYLLPVSFGEDKSSGQLGLEKRGHGLSSQLGAHGELLVDAICGDLYPRGTHMTSSGSQCCDHLYMSTFMASVPFSSPPVTLGCGKQPGSQCSAP